jgi:hypothetical protein
VSSAIKQSLDLSPIRRTPLRLVESVVDDSPDRPTGLT